MIAATWRQYRRMMTVLLGVFLLLTVVVLASGGILRAYRAENTGANPQYARGGCTSLECYAGSAVGWIGGVLALTAIGLGALIGATVVAREIDNRTHVLAFTQSASRFRWYIAHVVAVFLPLSAATGVLGAALALTRTPGGNLYAGRFTHPIYLTWGPVTAAWMFTALVFGSVIGLLVKNSYAGPIAIVVLFLGATFFSALVRPHLAQPQERHEPLATVWTGVSMSDGPEVFTRYQDWLLMSRVVDSDGEVLDQDELCPRWVLANRTEADVAEVRITSEQAMVDCLREQRAVANVVYFHPDENFWPIQMRETGLVVLAGLILLLLARWQLNRL